MYVLYKSDFFLLYKTQFDRNKAIKELKVLFLGYILEQRIVPDCYLLIVCKKHECAKCVKSTKFCMT